MPAAPPQNDAPATRAQSCQDCRFYRFAGNIEALQRAGLSASGECQRYPQPVRKQPTGWCGEWEFGR